MDNSIWFNIKYGITHVLDMQSYDHVLFLFALTVCFSFKHWKHLLVLVSGFTIGHTVSICLTAYNIVKVDSNYIELLIPLTILATAIHNMYASNKSATTSKVTLFFAALFGIVHGFGFGREFNMFSGKSTNKLELLIEFALGIEISQIIVTCVVLLLGFICVSILKIKKRDWILVTSSIIIGLIIPMIIENSKFLNL